MHSDGCLCLAAFGFEFVGDGSSLFAFCIDRRVFPEVG